MKSEAEGFAAPVDDVAATPKAHEEASQEEAPKTPTTGWKRCYAQASSDDEPLRDKIVRRDGQGAARSAAHADAYSEERVEESQTWKATKRIWAGSATSGRLRKCGECFLARQPSLQIALSCNSM